jgi:hypothetical protein
VESGDKAMSFEAWKLIAQTHANALSLPPDLWVGVDDYELHEVAQLAFKQGQNPKAFIEEVFAEDLVRMEGERVEREQAIEEEEEEDMYDLGGDGDDD